MSLGEKKTLFFKLETMFCEQHLFACTRILRGKSKIHFSSVGTAMLVGCLVAGASLSPAAGGSVRTAGGRKCNGVLGAASHEDRPLSRAICSSLCLLV